MDSCCLPVSDFSAGRFCGAMGHHVRGCKIIKLILCGVICVENIFYDISIKKHCVENIVADKTECVSLCAMGMPRPRGKCEYHMRQDTLHEKLSNHLSPEVVQVAHLHLLT